MGYNARAPTRSMERPTLIAVIGGARPTAAMAAAAEEVGRELARRGAGVVCGGLGGVMEAACRGAVSEGGLTVGILPSNRAEDANEWVKVRIPTGIGIARNRLVALSGSAAIAIDGSYGTLTEIGFALVENIPVVALNSWELAIGGEPAEKGIHRVETPSEAAALAVDLAAERTGKS